MLHPAMPTQPTPMGPQCPGCGVVLRNFTCGFCGMAQWLYMPGMQMPAAQSVGQGPPPVAAVVEAGANASGQDVASKAFKLLTDIGTAFASSAGEQFGQSAASNMSGWGR
jgi:hypothetical protein